MHSTCQTRTMMTLEILICTMEERLGHVHEMLLPACDEIAYLVSCQYAQKEPPVPSELTLRPDVRVCFLQGKGLSNNRNNALQHAVNDILLIADDDCRFDPEGLRQIIQTYENEPSLDIALFRVQGMSKYYPEEPFVFTLSCFKGPYDVASVEMTMRRSSVEGLQFDPHFGLGSAYLASGEEQVWLCDALRMGRRVKWYPVTIASTTPGTTGERFLQDPAVQRSKGATFCYLFGPLRARWMCFKEAIHHFVYKRVDPLKLMYQMNIGIRYAQSLKS